MEKTISLTESEAHIIMDNILTHLECVDGFDRSNDSYKADWSVIDKLCAAGFRVPATYEKVVKS